MRRRPCRRTGRGRGFTLLEVLVALSILAVALTGALRALGNGAQSAGLLRERLLADWVARDQLARLRAQAAWPPVGRIEGEAEQAGRRYRWRQTTQGTPNPLFRRVELEVFEAAGESPRASLSAFVVEPQR
jgi:general secretion pathway protein I